MIEIEQHTREFSERHTALATAVEELNGAIEALKRKHLSVIKRRVAAAAEAEAALKDALTESAALFVKPRTVVMHGIRVGFAKGKGKIEFEDADQVVKLIKKYCADMADVLIVTTEKPSKDALQQLDVAMLKKLGCSVDETGDQVVIRPTDSNVDKMVKALLKDATAEQELA